MNCRCGGLSGSAFGNTRRGVAQYLEYAIFASSFSWAELVEPFSFSFSFSFSLLLVDIWMCFFCETKLHLFCPKGTFNTSTSSPLIALREGDHDVDVDVDVDGLVMWMGSISCTHVECSGPLMLLVLSDSIKLVKGFVVLSHLLSSPLFRIVILIVLFSCTDLSQVASSWTMASPPIWLLLFILVPCPLLNSSCWVIPLLILFFCSLRFTSCKHKLWLYSCAKQPHSLSQCRLFFSCGYWWSWRYCQYGSGLFGTRDSEAVGSIVENTN